VPAAGTTTDHRDHLRLRQVRVGDESFVLHSQTIRRNRLGVPTGQGIARAAVIPPLWRKDTQVRPDFSSDHLLLRQLVRRILRLLRSVFAAGWTLECFLPQSRLVINCRRMRVFLRWSGSRSRAPRSGTPCRATLPAGFGSGDLLRFSSTSSNLEKSGFKGDVRAPVRGHR
jgi:hypothetical protein